MHRLSNEKERFKNIALEMFQCSTMNVRVRKILISLEIFHKYFFLFGCIVFIYFSIASIFFKDDF